MSGRGRGRGRGGFAGSMSFSVENLGFGRGDLLPQSILAPPPTFPPLLTPPLPLDMDSDACRRVLSARRRLLLAWNRSPFFVRPAQQRAAIARYSDRYQSEESVRLRTNCYEDGSTLPEELRLDVRLSAKRSCNGARPKSVEAGAKKARKTKAAAAAVSDDAVIEKLTVLEETEKNPKKKVIGEEDGVDDGDGEDDEAANENRNSDEEVDEDDEMDCGNDYVNDYFDNGDGYLDAEDDALEEGPVF